MTSDEELLEDEEEILIYVELEGVVGGNTLTTEQLQLDMIGIDTEHPIMQINGRFYEGTYEDAIGTYMFFTKDENTMPEDFVFDTASTLKYFAKTRKLLKMQRIFIKHRTEVLGDSEDSRCIPNLNTITEAGVPFEHQEEALSFWKTIRDGRMNALNSYLEKQRIREEKKAQGIAVDSESDEDNPFIAYKYNVKTNLKSVNQPVNSLLKLNESNVENHGNTEELNEDVEKNERITPTVDNGLTNLEKLALHETDSGNLISEESELQDSSIDGQKSIEGDGRNKKVVVVHDPKKKRCIRKQMFVKNKIPTKVELVEEKRQGNKEKTESLNVKILQDIDKPEKSELPDSCARSCKEDEMDTTIQEGIAKEVPTVKVEEMSTVETQIIKRLKREAKMKEIAERLKTIAQCSTSAKLN